MRWTRLEYYTKVSDTRERSFPRGQQMSSFIETVKDPGIVAIAFFALFMVFEWASLRFLDEDERAQYRGYERMDSRASILMGFGLLFSCGGGCVFVLFG